MYAHADTTTSRDLTVNKKKKVGMATMSTTTTTNGGGGGGGRDLISELPDPILHCILSSLDITTVFETSFLSKRWRYLWTTLPFLNFDEKVYDFCSTFSQNEFMFFVDRVLILRNHNSNIQTFRFSHDTGFDYSIVSHISTWIQILIRNNVQLIHIQINSNYIELESFKLPISLFTCQSLTELKLDFFGENIVSRPRFEVPVVPASVICLPSLKTLHLKSLVLDNSVELLISRSLALETLVINSCIGSQVVNICNPQIKSLTIERMFRAESKSDTGHESCEIKVFAPKMTSFSCTDYIGYINRYSFVNNSSLVKAEVDIELDSDCYMDESYIDPSLTTNNGINCLRVTCNVRSLMLSAWFLELIVTPFLERLDNLHINPFYNLSILKLKTSFTKLQLCAITYLLEKCPNLETLVLNVTESRLRKSLWKNAGSWVWEAKLAPQYMMPHLRLVETRGVVESVNEFEFLKFLLKNAIVLEKMIVFTSKEELEDNTKRFRGFSEKLKSFREASSSCEILFM